METPRTIIFDFDGTIADSFALVIDIAHELTGIPPLSSQQIDALRRLPPLKAIREIGIPLTKVPRLIIQGRQRMLERIAEVHAFPHIPEILQALHQKGCRMLVMSSNSEENVRTFLRAQQLEHFFEGVQGGVALFSKAGMLKKMIRESGADPANTYYVGDEVRDAAAARKAGVQSVAVSWGYQARETLATQQPTFLFDQPAQLLQLAS